MARCSSVGRIFRLLARLVAPVLMVTTLTAIASSAPARAADNAIVVENAKPGSTDWDITGSGYDKLQGFATQLSVDQGGTVSFKIDYQDVGTTPTTPAGYRIDIYRLGYYGGDGARLVDTILPANITQQKQPACTLTDPTGVRLLDCGNWGVSASWTVPADAVSGIYIAKPTVTGQPTLTSHIVFVVRDDDGGSDILVQTSDTTWQAYNPYGGYNVYYTADGTTSDVAGNAQKVSYNRPFATRGGSEPENWVFNAEYPMLRWLERNGYDVSYTTHIDTGTHPERLLDHKVFMSSGHDEYWSQAQRDAVEAARAAGVNLAFFSGNEVYWHIRYEDSTLGTSGDQRTMVVYKEGSLGQLQEEHRRCYLNFACDPVSWTGLWREKTDATQTQSVIGYPENALTGQISWRDKTYSITVPSEYAALRFWRNTEVANLTGHQTVTLANGTLGYEWSPQYEDYLHWYPAGRVLLSDTQASSNWTTDEHHHLSLYRYVNGAKSSLVFGAGTVQWAWGLDSHHDRDASTENDNQQQATLNLLADMGAQPTTRQPTLVAAAQTTDATAPTVSITSPANGATVTAGPVTVTGTASDTGGVVGVVEVSTDNGYTWRPADGRGSWSFTYFASASGTIRVRAADDSANLSGEVTRSVTVAARTCAQASPCSIFPATTTGTENSETIPYELGAKFRSSKAGTITGIRFYKTAGNIGTHTGTLWSSAGTQLAQVQFTGESASGWQQATFSTPVAIIANTTYVASYHAPNGHYAVGTSFASAGFDYPPLRALQQGEDGDNGVYAQSATSTFPTSSYRSANYLVDVVFAAQTDTTAPTVVSAAPASGAADVPVAGAVSVTFSEPVAAPAGSVSLWVGGLSVAGSLSVSGSTVTFTPSSNLAYGTQYTMTVTTAVTDIVGNSLAADQAWSFTTVNGTFTPGTPTISGTLGVGKELTAATGTWTPGADSYAYQWLRDGVAITGAETSKYTVSTDDVGAKLSVKVTATKTGFNPLSATSAETVTVAEGTFTTGTPTISDTTPEIGQELTAGPGSWDPAPDTFGYQWLRGDTEITGATSATYTVTGEDADSTLKVKVTGSKAKYTTASATSDPTATVPKGTLTPATPTVAGDAVVGGTLRVVTGTWAPTPALAYQWLRRDTEISGATGSTYLVTPGDAGSTLKVRVTGTKTGYTTVSMTSVPTSVVPTPTVPTSSPNPTITGVARVGMPLMAVTGSWNPAPTKFAYQWYWLKNSGTRVSIKHATKATYTPTKGVQGRRLQVRIKASLSGTVVPRYSTPTGKVGAPMTGRTPRISDTTPTVGQILTANPGNWKPTNTTFTYQWYAKSTSGNVKKITGATTNTYTVDPRYTGYKIKVQVTGTAPTYKPVSRNSSYTHKVAG